MTKEIKNYSIVELVKIMDGIIGKHNAEAIRLYDLAYNDFDDAFPEIKPIIEELNDRLK